MQEKPKEPPAEKEESPKDCEEEAESEKPKRRSYYYDDAHGYEDYDDAEDGVDT